MSVPDSIMMAGCYTKWLGLKRPLMACFSMPQIRYIQADEEALPLEQHSVDGETPSV